MPALSLVVCIYRQRDLLERLLRETQGCYDDLVVVHDGPDTDAVRLTVEAMGGRFFAPARASHPAPPWPFAWAQAKHDWILRLDADEFPSPEMNAWLKQFREAAEPAVEVSGFTCIWPVWDGAKAVTKRWPAGRIFLFHRQRVRFLGMVENVPAPDGGYTPLDLVLHHQPTRPSLGLRNVLFRKQAYDWRRVIAQSLLGKPTDLPCWRWDSDVWDEGAERIRRRPLRMAASLLVKGTFRTLRDQWRKEGKILPLAALNAPIHHALFCVKYWQLRRRKRKIKS